MSSLVNCLPNVFEALVPDPRTVPKENTKANAHYKTAWIDTSENHANRIPRSKKYLPLEQNTAKPHG